MTTSMLRTAAFALVLAAGSAFWLGSGRTQEHYPLRSVKIVIPAAPGSTTDTLARIVAEHLGQTWGKPTIVENIPGGAMNIGAASVARAAPDGYTLLIAPPSPLSFNHLLYRDPGYDPTRFVPITMLAKIANVLVVRKDLPVSTVQELISLGKENPGKLSYASQGVGSTAHLSAAQLEVRSGMRMVHVPYRGAQPALTDVLAGHVDMFFDTLATSVPLYRDGKVKLIGVADLRLSTDPMIPGTSPICGAPTLSPTCRPLRNPDSRVSNRSPGSGLRLPRLLLRRLRRRSTATSWRFSTKKRCARYCRISRSSREQPRRPRRPNSLLRKRPCGAR